MSVSTFCVSLSFVFQILVMLWFKNPVLILTHLSLVLSQIQLQNILFVTQNSQALRFLLLLNLSSQFLQPITIIFLFWFLQSLNLMIQNLLVYLLKHIIFHLFLIKSSKHLFQSSTQDCQSTFSHNQKVFNSASSFQVSKLPFQHNVTTKLPVIVIPLRS